MLSSLRATVVAALALSAAASPHVSRSSAACANPKTIQSGTVPVGGVDILFETVACAGAVAPAADSLGGVLCILLGLFCPPKPVHVPQPITSTETVSTTETFTSTATVTSTASSVSATPTAPSVCGAACQYPHPPHAS
ncbi:hypothetical protein BC834DRAFT_629326 [Gloeopeniophorella convolvens]|nr:hypothetical protein BC834DRAFT_629326 [Gloeopeniophorella convolvens]